MDLIEFNLLPCGEEVQEEMSIRRAFSTHPSRVLDQLHKKGWSTYRLPNNREVLEFATIHLN